MTKQELKPFQFGGEAVMTSHVFDWGVGYRVHVRNAAGVFCFQDNWYETEKDAITEWNTGADSRKEDDVLGGFARSLSSENQKMQKELVHRDALLAECEVVLKDCQLWIDEMQVGINKYAGDEVGLLGRQQNLNAFRNGDVAKLLTKLKERGE